MLEELVRFSIRRRGLVLVLAALGRIVGGVATVKLSLAAVPDVTFSVGIILRSIPSLEQTALLRRLCV